jgi:FtsZ-interacting cell division protein ZipA
MDILNMSDLQISLIIIGIIIIAGVALFNWVQQLRYRRKIQAAFNHEHDDVLLDKINISDTNERIEPKLNKSILSEIQTDLAEQVTQPEVTRETPSLTPTGPTTPDFDSKSNYIVNITPGPNSNIPYTQISPLLQKGFNFGKPLYWLGKKQENEPWEEITIKNGTENDGYISLKGCLQLADRSGPISEVNLSKFRDMAQDFVSKIDATVDCPDIVTSYEQAVILDKFCAEVDVMIGINIISKDNGAFVGTKIRALAEASGFKLDTTDGLFKYRDDNDQIFFTLTNYESAPFLPNNMKTLTTHGITFLLDVPRVANGERVFDQMTHLAKIFSNTLGGILVDDNRVPLSDNGIARSKQQLVDIQLSMQKQNMSAGSQSALRLFV